MKAELGESKEFNSAQANQGSGSLKAIYQCRDTVTL